MSVMTEIPGADELVGKGVYCGMPNDIPQPVRDRHAVVIGERADCAAAAQRLREAGWKVTVMPREGCRDCGARCECRRTARTDLVCAAGIEYLEAVVLRRIETRRIEACNASALFIL